MAPQGAIRLHRSQLRRAAEFSARAFADTPHIGYFFPDEDRRAQNARALFEMRIRYGLRKGEVYAPSSKLEAIAVWIPSKHASMTVWGQLRAGGMRLYRTVGADSVARMTHVEKHNDLLRERYAPETFMFLSVLAVDPGHQGRGHASGLVEAMLHRLDRDRIPCYLETTEEAIASFYRRFGFVRGDVSIVPGTDLTVWPMVRAPRELGYRAGAGQ